MPTPFALLEQRVNADVHALLANVEVVISGQPLAGRFGNEYVERLGQAGSTPVLRLLTSDLAAPPVRGQVLTIDGVTWKVALAHIDGGDLVIYVEA